MADNPSELLKFAAIEGYAQNYLRDIHDDVYFGFPVSGILEAENLLRAAGTKAIAYFSMEYGLATNVYNVLDSSQPVKTANRLSENEIFSNERIVDFLFSLKIDAFLDLPIYSGGLGVLAGDTVKTAADMKMPFVAVGILWNKGYFKQRFWFKFGQLPEEMKWDPWTFPGLIPLQDKVKLELKDRNIFLRLWKYYVFNQHRDFAVPLILLDSNVEENDEPTRKLTDRLYKSDDADGRLLQRLILGMGGVKAMQAMGYAIGLYHLNEGHAAFALIQDTEGRFAYTCHTPVPAGHDRFELGDVERILKPEDLKVVAEFGVEGAKSGVVNLTLLAMNLSQGINAVSKKHGEVMNLQFPAHSGRIRSVTNGVHWLTWISEPVLKVLDAHGKTLGDFRSDPTLLKNASKLRSDDSFRLALWQAHQENKKNLARLLYRWKLREDVLTLAWARRIAAYKRPSLIFQDLERLKDMAHSIGPLQILFAGKAHPNDNLAFTYINEIMSRIDKTDANRDSVRIIMLENYDTYIAKLLVSSVDIWLNNPLPPYEASGTSGMKAMANGVLQLSTFDGWVLEAADHAIGKLFGHKDEGKAFSDSMALRLQEDSKALYEALEDIMRHYYAGNKESGLDIRSPWIDMMINCIIEAGEFNTYRMLREYRSFIWNL